MDLYTHDFYFRHTISLKLFTENKLRIFPLFFISLTQRQYVKLQIKLLIKLVSTTSWFYDVLVQ